MIVKFTLAFVPNSQNRYALLYLAVGLGTILTSGLLVELSSSCADTVLWMVNLFVPVHPFESVIVTV